MTRMELPTTPGDYNIDGISIIVLPGKIIVDTGGRQYQSQTAGKSKKNRNADAQPERKKDKGGAGSMINSVLDSCQEFVMPGSTKRR